MSFKIITDTTAGLPIDIVKKSVEELRMIINRR